MPIIVFYSTVTLQGWYVFKQQLLGLFKKFQAPLLCMAKKGRVFLNQTETLVACGYLLGAHPGHLHRDKVEEELWGNLSLEPNELNFQLSSRSISVPIKEGEPGRYSLHVVVVETASKDAAALRERFYERQHPDKARDIYPYTGVNQFIPMVKSKEWPTAKIYQLAQLHVSLVTTLRP
jgi:hypothetical protein